MEVNGKKIDLDVLSIEELKALAAKIDSQQQHWKSCQDGSYECALVCMGYWDVRKKIRQLEDAA